ncbi:MAG TPA: hypothetical protein VGC29_09745 [Flavisolibacter sp.]
MKKKLLTVLMIFISSTLIAQDPAQPCCSVIGIDPGTKTVIARNVKTGRLISFHVSETDIKTVKLKDPVIAGTDLTVSSINGVVKKYKAEPVNVLRVSNAEPVNAVNKGKINQAEPAGLVQVDNQEPCCAVVTIDNVEPCCSMISAKNKTTGATISFRVPREIAKTVSIGDPAYSEPVNGLVIIQSSYQNNNGELSSYGYPIENSDNGTEEKASDKWVISNASMKGVLGRLNLDFPKDVEWDVDIKHTDGKFITNRSSASRHGSYDMAPGHYNFRLNTVTVENVPIEKGKQTRLKAGYLQVVSEGDWDLYDDSKRKFLTSGNKPTKMALPVGSYQLKLGGQFYPVVIKDKETVEY